MRVKSRRQQLRVLLAAATCRGSWTDFGFCRDR